MKLIAGLGNPGTKYAGTRHNVGFHVIDILADRWNVDMGREKFHAWFGEGFVGGEKIVLLKPTTFMNRSGQAIAAAGRFYQISLPDLLVIVDDLALPLGRIRLRPGGSPGGHNGLADIVQKAGTNEFPRLRVGIGQPLGNQVSFVLSRFHPDEEPVVNQMVEESAAAVECWIKNGSDVTMARYNAGKKDTPKKGDDE